MKFSWALCLGGIMLLSFGNVAEPQVSLPTGAVNACKISRMDIDNYIRVPQAAAAANIPDNTQFYPTGADDCPFHQAAQRMFLWLTSRRAPAGDNDSYVFNSDELFADIAPEDASGRRSIIGNRPGTPPSGGSPALWDVMLTQSGPGGRLVVFADTGKMFDVVPPAHVKKLSGKDQDLLLPIQSFRVEVGGYKIVVGAGSERFVFQNEPKAKNGKARLLDAAGHEIDFSGQKVLVNGRSSPLDIHGNVINYGPGQSDEQKHVLMTADRRLVYYRIEINDVYQRFLAAYADMNQKPTQFPSSLDEVDTSLPDKTALIVEIKTSWVDVCDRITYEACEGKRRKAREKYLILDATIPTYVRSRSDPSVLVRESGKGKRTTLALIGMHIAFTAKGFAGMLWSTFEHVNNARNVEYSYYDDSFMIKQQKYDRAGDWLLAGTATSCSRKNADNANVPIMQMQGTDIKPIGRHVIGPSKVCRRSPWGTFETPLLSFDKSNWIMIALNKSVQDAFTGFAPADVRRNYMHIGTTWFRDNQMPSPYNADHRGTNSLANSTMETFQQDKANNCLTCHRSDAPDSTLLDVSHIWRQLSGAKSN